MDQNVLLTIIIPTYNRKMELQRAIQSLEAQTCKDFKCIVVDDGSVDGTDQIVKDMISTLNFDLRYLYKENGGVLSARYFALQYVDTEMVMNLDSDDELTPDAIETLLNTWNSLTPAEKNKHNYGIAALCMDSVNKSIFGGEFESKVNDLNYKKYLIALHKGEREEMRRTNVMLEQYERFNKLCNELNSKFIPEIVFNFDYDLKYRYYCLNKVIRIYHTEDDNSICRNKLSLKSSKISYYVYRYCILNYVNKKRTPFKIKAKFAIYMIRFGLNIGMKLTDIFKDAKLLNNKMLLIFLLPLGLANYILGQKPEVE